MLFNTYAWGSFGTSPNLKKEDKWLTFTSTGGKTDITVVNYYGYEDLADAWYSLDNGITWAQFTGLTISFEGNLLMKGTNPREWYDNYSKISLLANNTTPDAKCTVSGNIKYLLGEDFNDILPEFCFYYLFLGNPIFNDYGYVDYYESNLVSAKDLILPFTELSKSCYEEMFQGCEELKYVPKLPATTLAERCYYSMFGECHSLITTPILPAINLVKECYLLMFNNCTSLTEISDIKAQVLAEACYGYMFVGCSSLTKAPELPITTLAESCYLGMFAYCTSLTTTPELPATTLAKSCYESMFENCTNLTNIKPLSATILAEKCYREMFEECTALQKAPDLLATVLVTDCYDHMFYSCSALNYIKMTATDVSASGCSDWWVYGVQTTGTFVKAKDVTINTGASGIPSGWTIEEV